MTNMIPQGMPLHIYDSGVFIGYIWVNRPSKETLEAIVIRLRNDFGTDVDIEVPDPEEFNADANRLTQYE